MYITYRYRVKSLEGLLRKQAQAVNYVWNYCNETQKSYLRLGKKWLNHFDLTKLTTGVSKELGINSDTIGAICKKYVLSRRQHKRPFLRWRTKKSLGWIPLRGRHLEQTPNGFKYGGKIFKVFLSRPIPPVAKICDGSSFSEDARGRWYINLLLKLPDETVRPVQTAVGIDLGLKDLAVLSNGEKVETPKFFRGLEEKLGKAQRAKKKRLEKSIHAKISNSRKDFLHKLSTRIVKRFDWIAVGNVSSSKLAKTRMAKSVLDAGWSSFRSFLAYKALACGATFMEVNESFSTQVCSSCGCIPPESPKGIADLGIRNWTCGDCGAVHDRDVNSANNILFGSGCRTPVEGTLIENMKETSNPDLSKCEKVFTFK